MLINTSPELDEEPSPDLIHMFPPVPEDMSPDFIAMMPPLPLDPLPTEIFIDPPRPAEAKLVPISISPVFPILLVPELKPNLPLMPLEPALVVLMFIEPLDEIIPSPVYILMEPPVLTSELVLPEERNILPPDPQFPLPTVR